MKNNNEGDNFSAMFFLMEEEYNILTKKELERICDYYEISKRKKRKADIRNAPMPRMRGYILVREFSICPAMNYK